MKRHHLFAYCAIGVLAGVLSGLALGYQMGGAANRGRAKSIDDLKDGTVYVIHDLYNGNTWVSQQPNGEIDYCYLGRTNLAKDTKFMKLNGAIVLVQTP